MVAVTEHSRPLINCGVSRRFLRPHGDLFEQYNNVGNTTTSTNAAGSGVNSVFNAFGQPVSYTVSQTANGINFTQTETIQYDALGRPLGEYDSGAFPGEAGTIQTQHTLSYNALTGQVISDTNALTTNPTTAPEGTDPARYVYAPDGTLLLREMGVSGATTPTQTLYALTDSTGTVVAIAGATGVVDERYVFDGLGNAQALQADGTPYDVTTFSNPNRSANWEFQQQFSGSQFDTGTQLLNYEGTDYAWNIIYHGQMYDGIPGVYETANGAFNPRQAVSLSPNPAMQLAGLSAYSQPTGFWGFYARHEQGIAFGASAVAGTALSVATWGVAAPEVAAALGVEATSLGILGTAALGAITGAAGGAASGFAYSATQGESPWQIAEGTGENALYGGITGGVFGAAGSLVGRAAETVSTLNLNAESANSLNILNPEFTPDPVAIMQAHVDEVSAALRADPTLAQNFLSRAEYTQFQTPGGYAMNYGKAVERFTASEIANNPFSNSLFKPIGGPNSPDFIGLPNTAADSFQFDITTYNGIGSHMARSYGPDTYIIPYQR